jgi:hypothetical protein
MNPKNGKGTAPCRQAVRGAGVETGLVCATSNSIASDAGMVKGGMHFGAMIEVGAILGIHKYDPGEPVEVTIETDGVQETALFFSEEQLLALNVMIRKFFETGSSKEINDARRDVGQNGFNVDLHVDEDGVSVELGPLGEMDFPATAILTLKDPEGRKANLVMNPNLARAVREKLDGLIAVEKALTGFAGQDLA